MRSFVVFNRQVAFFAVVGALLLAIILPVIASAAQLTERSIALSSSSKQATDVTYEIKFKADGAAEAVVIDFCSNTPLIGEACTAPTGFNSEAATTPTPSTSVAPLGIGDENTVVITKTIAATSSQTITLEGITNPDAVGPIYARIVTYDTAGNAANYDSADTFSEDANRVDEGGASILITDTIGVSAAVLESMTFCVSGQAIADGCTGVTAPTLKLGEGVGDLLALVPGTVSEGSIYTQITTNAATGAVISLKSNTIGCGGLVRGGATNCDIAPAQNTDVTIADAKFGVKTTTSTGGSGALQPANGSIYTPSAFKMNWITGDSTGVTSTFGDPFLDTANAPATNRNMELIFGASVINETPAGLYSADLNLIATGKF